MVAMVWFKKNRLILKLYYSKTLCIILIRHFKHDSDFYSVQTPKNCCENLSELFRIVHGKWPEANVCGKQNRYYLPKLQHLSIHFSVKIVFSLIISGLESIINFFSDVNLQKSEVPFVECWNGSGGIYHW